MLTLPFFPITADCAPSDQPYIPLEEVQPQKKIIRPPSDQVVIIE